MKHKDAIRDNAVERYLLGQMTEDQRKIFEEHYFDCPICAADVTDGTRMMIAAKGVAAEDPQRWNVVQMPRPFWVPAAAAASLVCALLGGQVGYHVAMQQRPATELVHVTRLETSVPRGAGAKPPEVPVVRSGDALRFTVEASDDAVEYAAVVRCGGKTQSTHGISRALAAEPVTLRIDELPAGPCELVIESVRKDGKRFEISNKPFKVVER
jgi:anti-sigma factor RsiW